MSDLQTRLAAACERLGIERRIGCFHCGTDGIVRGYSCPVCKGKAHGLLPTPVLIERLEAWAGKTTVRREAWVYETMGVLKVGQYDFPETCISRMLKMTEAQRAEAVLAVAEKEGM